MTDFSFLRLSNDFATAKYDAMHESEYYYNGGVCLHPKEKYLQITNSSTDIAFDDSYKVELVDCHENILLDITSKVFITEFQDNKGVYQIAYEILPILQDFYYKELYLKFTHLDSTLRLYSNNFLLTAELEKESFRLDYKSYSIYKGTNYVLADYYQSIRLCGYYNAIAEKKESQTYTQLNGKVRKSRVIQDFAYTYEIDEINSFVYERLSIALESDLVFLNGQRITNLGELNAGERIGKTNFFSATFEIQFENEFYNDVNQFAPIFNYTELVPFNIYTLINIPTEGQAIFNYNIDFIGGTLKLYNYDTDILLNEINISITDNYFTFTMPILPNGNYYFLFENLVKSEYEAIVNITDKDVWTFSIQDGEFDNTEFDNTEFLVN